MSSRLTGVKRARVTGFLREPGHAQGLLVIPAVLYLLLFYVWPLAIIAARAFFDPQPGLHNFEAVLGGALGQRSLLLTVQTAVGVTLLCLVLAYPLAYVILLAPPRVAGLMLALVLVALWLNVVARSFAWTVLLRDTGAMNSVLMSAGIIEEPISLIRTPLGVAIGMASVLTPTMVLPIFVIMRGIDPELSVAAAGLGAGPIRSFLRVFLPMSMPGVLGGCLLVFVLSLGFYITPTMLGGGSYLMVGQIVVDEVRLLQWGYGSALSCILLVMTLATLGLAARVVRPGAMLGMTSG